MSTITKFNKQTLVDHTPLTIGQAITILMLVDKHDTEKLNSILAGKVTFDPPDTFFERLKQALIVGKI